MGADPRTVLVSIFGMTLVCFWGLTNKTTSGGIVCTCGVPSLFHLWDDLVCLWGVSFKTTLGGIVCTCGVPFSRPTAHEGTL